VKKRAELKDDVFLQEHQQRVLDKLKTDVAGLILVHGLGSGKTLSSIAAAEELGFDADVVVPASLRENYRKEIAKFTEGDSKDYSLKSYNEVASNEFALSPKEKQLLILDEAHRLRERSTKATKAIEGSSPSYNKRLLLTGTPIINRPDDLVALLNIVSGDSSLNSEKFKEDFIAHKRVSPGFFARLMGVKDGSIPVVKNPNKFKKKFSRFFDFHGGSTDEFPEVEEEKIQVEMDPLQQEIYDGLLDKNPILAYKVRKNLPPSKTESRQLNAFLSAVRQVSNTPVGFSKKELDINNAPKLKSIADRVIESYKKDPKNKSVVYSNYLSSGVEPIADSLEREGIPYAIFDGSLNDKKRKEIIDAYNSDKINTLLVSGAGSEGLDLKGTRSLHVTEPHWNDARIRQMIGRAARFRSHSHLPKEDRKLNVFKYQSKPKRSFFQRLFGSKVTGTDEYLEELSRQKDELNNQFLDLIKGEK